MFVSGVFICRGKEDALVTKNMVVGESVYGEKRMSVEVRDGCTAWIWDYSSLKFYIFPQIQWGK